MYGMSRDTGQALDAAAHVEQSIVDILTTPIGSRLWRRDYGSSLFELIDRVLNSGTLVQIFAAVADALNKWEPRFILERLAVESVNHDYGVLVLLLAGRVDLTRYSNATAATSPTASAGAVVISVALSNGANTRVIGGMTAKPYVTREPLVTVAGNVTTITLTVAPVEGLPVQVHFNGVSRDIFSVAGNVITVPGYDGSGDEVSVYYYINEVAA